MELQKGGQLQKGCSVIVPLLPMTSYPLPDPSHTPVPACPPAPIFAFLWTLCFAYISISIYLYMYILNNMYLTAFFGVLSAARVEGMYFHLVWEPGPQKVRKYSCTPSDTCPMNPS